MQYLIIANINYVKNKELEIHFMYININILNIFPSEATLDVFIVEDKTP